MAKKNNGDRDSPSYVSAKKGQSERGLPRSRKKKTHKKNGGRSETGRFHENDITPLEENLYTIRRKSAVGWGGRGGSLQVGLEINVQGPGEGANRKGACSKARKFESHQFVCNQDTLHTIQPHLLRETLLKKLPSWEDRERPEL